jgi:hypothetical protein
MSFGRIAVLLGAAVLLAGCQTAGMTPKATEVRLGPPVNLRVAQVMIEDATTPSTDAARIEARLLPTTAEAARRALEQHYLSTMSSGAPVLRFTISEASVTETKLPIPEGQLDRMFRKGPDTRYEGRLVLDAQMGRQGTSKSGYARAEATRQLEVGNLSGDERMKQVNMMVTQMVVDAVNSLDRQMADSMGGIYAPTPSNADINYMPQTSGRWDKVRNWQ